MTVKNITGILTVKFKWYYYEGVIFHSMSPQDEAQSVLGLM